MSTTPLHAELRDLIRRSRAAVEDARARMRVYRAWELLQVCDQDGDWKGDLPYSDGALAEFQAVHQADPDDWGVVHHLAVAHHARAWDWELSGDPRAPAEWERALSYWRVLAFAGPFWSELERKFRLCDPEAAESPVPRLHSDLLESLLDIHVDFVRHYSERGTSERALSHVEIVRRAALPLAVQRRLLAKVFEAMTASVPAAKASGDFESALVVLERFLALFPDGLQALRLHAEVSEASLGGLSYKDDWERILAAAERAKPWVASLVAHPGLPGAPLAANAAESFAAAMMRLALGRAGSSHLDADWEEARDALGTAIEWGRLVLPICADQADVRTLLASSLMNHAICLHEVLCRQVIADPDVNDRTKLVVALKRHRQGVAELEEAAAVAGPDSELRAQIESTLAGLRNVLAQEETQERYL